MADMEENGSVEEGVVIPLTEEEVRIIEELKQLEDAKTRLRFRREHEWFPIVNRSPIWYKSLTEEQLNELEILNQKWLDITDTLIVPKKPFWL